MCASGSPATSSRFAGYGVARSRFARARGGRPRGEWRAHSALARHRLGGTRACAHPLAHDLESIRTLTEGWANVELLEKLGWRVVEVESVDLDSGEVLEVLPYVLDEEG